MRCEACRGTGWANWMNLTRPGLRVRYSCAECGGSGIAHCCEGLVAQPEEGAMKRERHLHVIDGGRPEPTVLGIPPERTDCPATLDDHEVLLCSYHAGHRDEHQTLSGPGFVRAAWPNICLYCRAAIGRGGTVVWVGEAHPDTPLAHKPCWDREQIGAAPLATPAV